MPGIEREGEGDREPLGAEASERDVRAALITSETLLRQTLEGTQTGSWYWDIPTNVVSWSDNLGPLHGLPRGTQPSDYAAYLELIHPHDRERIQAAVGAALEDGTGYEIELRTAPREGVVRWIWASATVLKDEQGAPNRIVGLTRDITARKRQTERETVLAELALLLERADEPRAATRALTQLLVTQLADWCAVRLATEDGVEDVVVAYSDELRADGEGERLRVAIEAAIDPQLVAARGATVLHGEPEAAGEEPARTVWSAIVAPLRARGDAVGTLTLGAGPSGRRYDELDRELVDDLAGRLAAEIAGHASTRRSAQHDGRPRWRRGTPRGCSRSPPGSRPRRRARRSRT